MDPIQISSPQAVIYVAVLNAAIGFVLGLIPLLLGYFYKQLRIGVMGIVAATVGGSILGIFASIPAAIIFTLLVIRRSKVAGNETRAAGDVASDDLSSND